MNLQKHQHGVTLLEIMLVMAIAATFFAFGVRVYSQFQFQAKEQVIAANVNQLFQALEGYYSANCRQTIDASMNAVSSGALDPRVADSGGIRSSISLNINTDLITPGFLISWRPNSTLVDNTATASGYSVQYNRVLAGSIDPVMNINSCGGSTAPPSCDNIVGAAVTSTPTGASRAVTFITQVAVKLATTLTPAQWIQIRNDLNADCISSSTNKSACTTSPSGSTGYLIFTKTPSAYNPNISSEYWISNPTVKQFNNQYTNDPLAAMSGVTNEVQNWYNPLNYLCGG